MYQAHLDKVVAWATADRFKDDVAAARREFAAATGGDVFEDDRSMESRLAAFVDWYVLDRKRGASTPAEAFVAEEGERIHPSELPIYRAFTETVRGLFELKKPPKNERLRVRELIGEKDYEVFERRVLAGLAKGDVFEARLIPFKGDLFFSSAFCYHPRPAKKPILSELKRRRKAGAIEPGAFLNTLLAMELKFERYRNVAVEAIYSFHAP
ncbi:MAG TPA: hypothetical protein VMB50_15680 [Myxococcales bacterium]|nr:hypothetical protein [Myxococcales bacterium]